MAQVGPPCSGTAVATAVVERYEPPFFVIGAEINRIWEQHPAGYDAFVAAWPAVYEAIKASSPRTEVGASFQYEFMRGAGFLSGQVRDPHWQLLDAFAGHLDFVGGGNGGIAVGWGDGAGGFTRQLVNTAQDWWTTAAGEIPSAAH